MGNEEIRKEAYKDYLAGMKYQDIANKHHVNLSTVKSWASRYWKKGCNQTEKKLQPKNKKVATSSHKKRRDEKETWTEEENLDLTDKQALFCLYYVNSYNATTSYQKAYGCNRENAMAAGSRMLRNVKVKNEIERLKKEKYETLMFDERDIFQWHLEIATASITDFVSFGREEVQLINMFGPVVDKETKEPVMKEVNYVKFKSSDEVDGRLIKKVKMGKDGASIELYDAQKSMEWLSKNMNMGTNEQQSLANQIVEAYRKRKEAEENDG